MSADLHLAIVEPAGRARTHPKAYPDYAGEPMVEHERHSPAEICSFAACAAGTYHGCGSSRRGRNVSAKTTAVLLMIENMRQCLRVLRWLQTKGKDRGGRTTDQVVELAGRLIQYPAEADAAVAKALALAAEHVSFAAVRARLVEFYAELGCLADAAA